MEWKKGRAVEKVTSSRGWVVNGLNGLSACVTAAVQRPHVRSLRRGERKGPKTERSLQTMPQRAVWLSGGRWQQVSQIATSVGGRDSQKRRTDGTAVVSYVSANSRYSSLRGVVEKKWSIADSACFVAIDFSEPASSVTDSLSVVGPADIFWSEHRRCFFCFLNLSEWVVRARVAFEVGSVMRRT